MQPWESRAKKLKDLKSGRLSVSLDFISHDSQPLLGPTRTRSSQDSTMSRLTLKDQLRELENNDDEPLDPENAYSSLDTVQIGNNAQSRDDYLEVGPSRLRDQIGNGDQVLLGDKYAGTTVKRNKIFDDEESEEDEPEVGHGDEDDEEDEMEEDASDEEGSGGDDEELDGEEEEEVEDEEDDAEGDEDQDVEEGRTAAASSSHQTRHLDPVGALRQARAKDIERGRGIRRQKALFDAIVALRITFQKTLVASTSLSSPGPSDSSGELDRRKAEALDKLLALSDDIFKLRRGTALPDTDPEAIAGIGKRKRGDAGDVTQLLVASVNDSAKLSDAQRAALVPTLTKWNSKIQAATINVTSKAAGSSKFLQATKSQQSIVEVIQADLSNAANSENTFMENEEAGYRTLLREVIESRSAGGGADLTHLRREKKKKREAERGGSKGRKLRYTVHEKAQHFAVPVPLRNGWHDEQVDELFLSLLDGAGVKGAGTEGGGLEGQMNGDNGLADLGGLRVF